MLPLCVLVKKFTNTKLIYDAHELETETNGSHGIRKKIAKVMERFLIKYVDHTFVVSESIANYYRNLYQKANITCVLNAPVQKRVIRNNLLRERLGISEDVKIFLYQGVLAEGRGIEIIINTFSKLKNMKACIVFMGYGPLADEIVNYQKNSNNVFYFPAVSPEQVHEHTSSADIGIALIQNTCLSYEYCMPNKLFEYGMASLPCIVSPLIEMERYVTENKCGFILTDISVDSFDTVIRQVCSSDLSEFKLNARDSALDNSWEVQEKIMHEVYEDIFGVIK